jgi:hypothetical protein
MRDHTPATVAMAAGLAVCLALGSAGPAAAAPITYDLTATVTSGPLLGQILPGSFTYDSSSVLPGQVVTGTNLLTDLTFSLNGIAYDETAVNTGALVFDANGVLLDALFGTNCQAGSCSVSGGANAFTLSLSGGLTYAVPGLPGLYAAEVTATERAVPEPAGWLVLATGLAALGVLRGRAGEGWRAPSLFAGSRRRCALS